MKKILTILTVIAITFACNSTQTDNSGSEDQIKKLTIEELNNNASELNAATVQVSGMVFHVCKHGGQKMFIRNDSTETAVLIRVGQTIPEFDVALEGSNVEVTGVVMVSLGEPQEGEHEEGMGEMSGEENSEECTTEEQMKKQDTTPGITYYIEAASFKEII